VSIAVSSSGLPSLDGGASHLVVSNGASGTYLLSEANGFNLNPGRYYLLLQSGMESPGGHVTLDVAVNPPAAKPTVIPLLENGVSTPGTISAGPGLSYYSFTVPDGATGARFELNTLGDDLNLYLRRSGTAEQSLPSLTEYDSRSITVGSIDEAIFLVPDANTTNSLASGTWFIAVQNRSSGVRSFNLKATSFSGFPYEILPVTSGAAVTGLATVGNAPATLYRLNVGSLQRGLLFEVRNLDGNGDLVIRKGAPPSSNTHDAAGFMGGTADELVIVRTNAADATLVGDWYFGILNRDESRVSYSVVAKEPQGGLLLSESPTELKSLRLVSAGGSQPDFGFDLQVIPGETYQVQFAHNAQGPWFILTNLVAAADGAIEFVHREAVANPRLFYRVQQVPPR
jgi:hypothetical protein